MGGGGGDILSGAVFKIHFVHLNVVILKKTTEDIIFMWAYEQNSALKKLKERTENYEVI